jgi:hypothetical protein
MAISLLAVLKSVPWSDVISNAPAVAEGARKLWNTVSKKPSGASKQSGPSQDEAAEPALEARVGVLVSQVADLHAQMLASSKLIRALADQNGQLIARVEVLRRRILLLSVAMAATAVVAITGLAIAWIR